MVAGAGAISGGGTSLVPRGAMARVHGKSTVKLTAKGMESLLLLLAFMLAIGAYTGYRLVGLWQFEPLVKE